MKKKVVEFEKIIFIFWVQGLSFVTKYKHDCLDSNKSIETIIVSKNTTANPFLIRTNEQKSIEKFYAIASKYKFERTKDSLVINCQDEINCSRLSYDLIVNGITNIDLGLFQINYNSYQYHPQVYFNKEYSYKVACAVVIDKIKAQKKWNWETLASYHSATPHLNKIYKDQLINNYLKLTRNENDKSNNIKN